ncbi:Hypothetical transmembrane protein [Gluconobacter oxydans 621H]|uniref:Hypothetical transmembrane protein n=1 Tax=Gluconobacter oxydans (strain 621H) TaxID=290633 RepID=Q5FPL5_GLUOX|nr:DUF4175 family protein [Gluconobacter oxydans]AAW61681.1 Hypothetical transmembrane protein [Gluconobacter oxydans 621H]
MAEPNPALHLKALRRKAQRVLWWERAWEPLRWPLLLVAFYVLACLARIPQSLPDWLHTLLEAGVLGTALWLTITGLRRVPSVSIPVADRRIEHDSKLAYQPLLSLTDRPAFAGNGEQSAIWSRHVERVTASLGTLRVGLPHPETSLHERLALIAVPLAIVVAAILGGTHTPSRLHAGLLPGVDDNSIPLPTLQAWIDRPSYAPGAPIFLSATGHNTLDVPQGAILNATITGAHGKPALHGIASPEQNRLDAESWNSHGTLQQSGTISIVVRGRTLGSWRVKVEPDLPPTVTWDGKPGPQKDDWRTGLPWHVHQTYGVASLEAEINLPGLTRGRILRVPIPLDGQPKDAKGVATPDLSSDPFAGMEVEGRLHAKSASGRESRSDIVKFQIAARKFTDPLARALVALRRRLMLGQQRARRPQPN